MSSKNYRFALSATTSLIAAAIAATPVLAQDGQQAQGGLALEEIIVNARRVDENIQRVPIAVTAFSAEKLQQQDVKDIFTLTKNIGGLNICCSPGNTSFIFLRGIANGTPSYFADVPTAPNGFANFFDIASVQVLKGPQGTLFGQASNAGALVYQPKKPGEVLGGFVSLTGGNYSRRSIEAGLDVPIVEDRVLFRMAAQSYYREGYVEDIRTNRAAGEQNYYILRPSLILRPTEDIENYTIFQYVKSKGMPLASGYLTDFNFTNTPLNTASVNATTGVITDARNSQAAINGGTLAAYNALRDQALARQIALGRYKFDGYSAGCSTPLGPVFGPAPTAASPLTTLDYARAACPYTWSRDVFLSNTTTWNFADKLSLKNIAGYRKGKTFNQPTDLDGTALLIQDGGSPRNVLAASTGVQAPFWSDELQLQGAKVFDFLDFTVGTFHTAQNGVSPPVYTLTNGTSNSAALTKSGTRSRAVYGQVNIDIGYFNEGLEGLTFTGGYRQTWDTVRNQRFNFSVNAATGALTPTTVQGGPTSPAGLAHFTAGSYTVGLQYQFTPDIMFYVTNSKGYSIGGLQNTAGFEVFQPDNLNNIEGGVKGTFDVGDVKVRTNVSYYYGWFNNVKVTISDLLQIQAAPAPKTLSTVTSNAAKAKIDGIDSDITILPTDWLELGGMFAYTNPRYTRFAGFNYLSQPVDLTSTIFNFVPKYKWSLRGTVHLPVDQATWGDMSVTANYTHTGSMANTVKSRTPTVAGNPNTAIVATRCRTTANGYGPLSADGVCVPIDINPAYHNLDMTFDWRDILGHEGLTGSVFVNNLTKNVNNDGGATLDSSGGFTGILPAVPRMFGVRLGYSF